jgi:hypothetical protein
MITDTEIKVKGIKALMDSLGSVDAERFISLNYTKWQRTLWDEQSVEEISRNAMKMMDKDAEL